MSGWQLQVTAMIPGGVNAGDRVLLICCERLGAATQTRNMRWGGGGRECDEVGCWQQICTVDPQGGMGVSQPESPSTESFSRAISSQGVLGVRKRETERDMILLPGDATLRSRSIGMAFMLV